MPSSSKYLSTPTNKVIAMVMHSHCNFSCVYCGIDEATKRNKSQMNKYYTGSYIDKFSSYGGGNSFVLSGGEPTLTPHIKEFVESLVESKNRVSFYTNLSCEVSWLIEYADKIDYIMAALGPYYDIESNFRIFSDKVERLRKNGVNVVVRFIATKGRVPLIEKYFNHFAAKDIPFLAYPEFKYSLGPHELESYSKDEYDRIFKYANYIGKMYLQHEGVKGNYLECLGGSKYIYVGPEWAEFKCVNFPNGCNVKCSACCTCDIQYFYGATGLTKVPIDDTTEEGYNKWIEENKLQDKWWR